MLVAKMNQNIYYLYDSENPDSFLSDLFLHSFTPVHSFQSLNNDQTHSTVLQGKGAFSLVFTASSYVLTNEWSSTCFKGEKKNEAGQLWLWLQLPFLTS